MEKIESVNASLLNKDADNIYNMLSYLADNIGFISCEMERLYRYVGRHRHVIDEYKKQELNTTYDIDEKELKELKKDFFNSLKGISE